MESVQCAACEQGRSGLIVRFPSQETCDLLQQSMIESLHEHWIRLDTTTMWLSLGFAFDAVPYWEEFHRPQEWRLAYAGLSTNGIVQETGMVAWEQFRSTNRGLWVEEIVQQDRLRMMAQPIVDVTERKVLGYELLARAVSKEGTIIPPTELYQAAREQNQLFRLDKACRIHGIETGQSFSEDKLIFINFIPTSIYVPEHCLATTINAVERCGIERQRVVFEVVETDQVQDMKHLRRILEYYRKQGFLTALDDVGSGFNNVSTLTALEPDIVKLDRAYVAGIQDSDAKREAAERICEAGKSVGARMLAEGIESPEESRVLSNMGYHWQQGYWFGRPSWTPEDVPVDRFKVNG